MPENSKRESEIELLKSLVYEIGDEVNSDLDGSVFGVPDGEGEIFGFWCSRGDNSYVIIGAEERRYFTVISLSSLVGTIARKLDEDEIDELSGDESDLDSSTRDLEDEPDEDIRRLNQAAVNWLEEVDDELMDEIKFHLRERLSSPEVAFDMKTSDKDALLGFSVERKIFPYEEDFGISEFDQSIQAVISVSVLAQNFLGESFDIESFDIAEPAVPADSV